MKCHMKKEVILPHLYYYTYKRNSNEKHGIVRGVQFCSNKIVWVCYSGLETENMAAGTSHADRLAPSIRKSWH
jgi:hypothetical protein